MFKACSDDVLAIYKELSINRENVSKNVPNSVKRQFKRKIKEWKAKGIVNGYLEYLIGSLKKYTYGNLLKIYLYAIYKEHTQTIYKYSKEVFVKVANDCYSQAKEERPHCPITIPDILTWTYISKWAKVLSANATYGEYLEVLVMTDSDEMFSKCMEHINIDDDLEEEDIEKTIDRQIKRILNINNDKFSGVLDSTSRAIGNKAYIEPFPNEKCLFIAEMDDRTTLMCQSLNNQVFNTIDKNKFKRYSASAQGIIEYEIDGMVEGINLPPIQDSFHWCRSTITYNFDENLID